MNRVRLYQTIFVVFSALWLAACSKPAPQIALSGNTMGTYYSVKYLPEKGMPEAAQVQAQIDARLAAVNALMSTYQPDSELSRFNQHQSTEAVALSANTLSVLQEAIRLYHLSDGALDVTVGPLVNLWGFGPEAKPEIAPTDAEIARKRAAIGMDKLHIDGNLAAKSLPNLYIDLSAIAKGFGVDDVANYLASIGVKNYLVEIGGELQLKGVNATGKPWRIAIEKPSNKLQQVQEVIAPKDMAVATSGDYRNYFEQDGVRYSHTIDPKTGKPIHHRLASVTVLDKSCMTADGLATAFMVMGHEDALALANRENIPAFFIVKTDDGFEEIASTAFQQYVAQ